MPADVQRAENTHDLSPRAIPRPAPESHVRRQDTHQLTWRVWWEDEFVPDLLTDICVCLPDWPVWTGSCRHQGQSHAQFEVHAGNMAAVCELGSAWRGPVGRWDGGLSVVVGVKLADSQACPCFSHCSSFCCHRHAFSICRLCVLIYITVGFYFFNCIQGS